MNKSAKVVLRGLSENSLICGRRHRIPFTQFPDAHSFPIDGEAPILRERDTEEIRKLVKREDELLAA